MSISFRRAMQLCLPFALVVFLIVSIQLGILCLCMLASAPHHQKSTVHIRRFKMSLRRPVPDSVLPLRSTLLHENAPPHHWKSTVRTTLLSVRSRCPCDVQCPIQLQVSHFCPQLNQPPIPRNQVLLLRSLPDVVGRFLRFRTLPFPPLFDAVVCVQSTPCCCFHEPLQRTAQ